MSLVRAVFALFDEVPVLVKRSALEARVGDVFAEVELDGGRSESYDFCGSRGENESDCFHGIDWFVPRWAKG